MNKLISHLVLLTLVFLTLVPIAGCKKRAPIAPPAPSPPATAPAPEPEVRLSADPSAIELGQSSTLNWSTTHATKASIDQNIGEVAISGSASVSPTSSTTYTITASGQGGSVTASTRIAVTVPAPEIPVAPRPEVESLEELFVKNVRDIYFDYDRAEIGGDARLVLASAAEFLTQNESLQFSIEGHCDERGSQEYNLGLGDRRANAARSYLANLGVSVDRMNAISYGKERPQCQESAEECYQRNRRAHFVLAKP